MELRGLRVPVATCPSAGLLGAVEGDLRPKVLLQKAIILRRRPQGKQAGQIGPRQRSMYVTQARERGLQVRVVACWLGGLLSLAEAQILANARTSSQQALYSSQIKLTPLLSVLREATPSSTPLQSAGVCGLQMLRRFGSWTSVDFCGFKISGFAAFYILYTIQTLAFHV